jgi:hypothetical protein
VATDRISRLCGSAVRCPFTYTALSTSVTTASNPGAADCTVAACYAERLPACRPALDLVVAAARDGGALPPAIDAVFELGIDCFLTGRWDEAERLVSEGLHWSEETGIALLQSPGHWLRALIAAGRGQSAGWKT